MRRGRSTASGRVTSLETSEEKKGLVSDRDGKSSTVECVSLEGSHGRWSDSYRYAMIKEVYSR